MTAADQSAGFAERISALYAGIRSAVAEQIRHELWFQAMSCIGEKGHDMSSCR